MIIFPFRCAKKRPYDTCFFKITNIIYNNLIVKTVRIIQNVKKSWKYLRGDQKYVRK